MFYENVFKLTANKNRKDGCLKSRDICVATAVFIEIFSKFKCVNQLFCIVYDNFKFSKVGPFYLDPTTKSLNRLLILYTPH